MAFRPKSKVVILCPQCRASIKKLSRRRRSRIKNLTSRYGPSYVLEF